MLKPSPIRGVKLALIGAVNIIAVAGAPSLSRADVLSDPPVFASRDGVLDIMMVAMPQAIPSIAFVPPGGGAPINPIGWVYQICPRPATGLACPWGSPTVAPYGGARLALQPGDTLKVRYVNRLPAVDPKKLKHSGDVGEDNLHLNPTNVHTHGLITPARSATFNNRTFGDYVFVSIFNSANGIPVPLMTHQHGPVVMDTVDYNIPIPSNHPSGIFWFHPHVHGIALNQVASGMSGLITIGLAGDYVRGSDGAPWPEAHVRHLMLKEIQVAAAGLINFGADDASGNPWGPQPVANGEVLNQEDPEFCAQFPAQGEVRQGSCPGIDHTGDPDGNNFTGGKWYMSVNGQQFPTIPITNPDGEVWRVGTGAGSLSWSLQLVDDSTQTAMTVQLIAIDGVAVNLPQNTPPGTIINLAGGNRFRVVPCPNAQVIGANVPVCVNQVIAMPSARVELHVTYRNAQGQIVPPPAGASATLKMVGLTMGTGDQWPAVDLAKVQFSQTGPRTALTSANHVLVGGPRDAYEVDQAWGQFGSPVIGATPAPPPAGCATLAPGHRRRIFFGFSNVAVNNTFALGYEEVDRNGNVVPGSQKPAPDQLEGFDPSHTTVCLPLGPGQTPVRETWELVQLSTENHNFHIHQTRFEPLGSNGNVKQDNIPLGVANPDPSILNTVLNNQNGVCTITQWRKGLCPPQNPTAQPIVLTIPFSELGEFVYHCHILEHEDGGMMARVMVVPSPY